MTVLTEQGLYFYLDRCDKPAALKYQMWIAGEVVPSIRKHGAYMTPGTIMESLAKPESIITLLENLRDTQLELRAAQDKLVESEDRVQLAKDFLEEGECINIADLAKKLNQEGTPLGRDRLFAFLRSEGILCAGKNTSALNTPTQYYMERKWFKLKETPIRIRGEIVFKKVTLVTPKGVEELSRYVHACFDEQPAE